MRRRICLLMVLACAPLAHAASLAASKATDMRDAVDRITIAAENNGYHLVKVQAIDSALVKRGFQDPGVRILFIGKASAMEAAAKDYPPLLGMLPLKLALIVRGTEIVATSDDLDRWKEMFPESQAHRLIEGWQKDLMQILADFSEP
jgi:uncharacterized protein (DUF302 family)